MALSDACFEFLDAVRMAASELAEQVHWYSAPGTPWRYGEEIDSLRRACASVLDAPYDMEAVTRLIRLADATMRYHDTVPVAPELAERREQMTRLIRLLQTDLDTEDAERVPAVVENAVQESRFTEAATARLKQMLPKLGKAGYDAAIKIISDIGSATAKKMLGL